MNAGPARAIKKSKSCTAPTIGSIVNEPVNDDQLDILSNKNLYAKGIVSTLAEELHPFATANEISRIVEAQMPSDEYSHPTFLRALDIGVQTGVIHENSGMYFLEETINPVDEDEIGTLQSLMMILFTLSFALGNLIHQ